MGGGSATLVCGPNFFFYFFFFFLNEPSLIKCYFSFIQPTHTKHNQLCHKHIILNPIQQKMMVSMLHPTGNFKYSCEIIDPTIDQSDWSVAVSIMSRLRLYCLKCLSFGLLCLVQCISSITYPLAPKGVQNSTVLYTN